MGTHSLQQILAAMVWALEFRDGLLVRSSPAQSVLEAEAMLVAER